MTKNPTAEQFTELNKHALEASVRFAEASFGAVERLVALNLAAVKEHFAASATDLKALTDIRDPQALLAKRGELADASLKRAVEYTHRLHALAKDGRSEFTKLVEERVGEINKQVVSTIEQVASKSPAGSEGIVAAVKTSLGATAAGMDAVGKAVKQVGEFVDAGVKATVDAAGAAVKTATKTTV
jgi:phasin family protein